MGGLHKTKSGKDIGRPVEFTADVVKKLEEAFSIDATVEEACFYANISRQTYYNNVMEISEKYTDVVVQRYVDYTGVTEIRKNGIIEEWNKTEKKSEISV
jgi:hypothetical protein